MRCIGAKVFYYTNVQLIVYLFTTDASTYYFKTPFIDYEGVKVIPVIDILGGDVVHAVAGERHHYKPIKSVLVDSSNPIQVARAFKEKLARTFLYVADLDAIMGSGDNSGVLWEIKQKFNFTMMIDAGAATLDDAVRLIKQGFDFVVLGTETLHSLDALKNIMDSSIGERVIASLDVKLQKTLSECAELSGLEPMGAANLLYEYGVRRLILLELDRVGTLKGPNLNLLGELCRIPFDEVLAGGGIRDKDDLWALKKLNISGVLVASALHTGRLTLKDLAKVEG